MASRATELRWALAAFAGLAAAFMAFPGLDLGASGLFFDNGNWLLNRDSAWLAVFYRGLPRLGQATLVILLLLWILSFVPALAKLRTKRAVFGFLFASGVLGPVLVVDDVLKDHSGRARPINVQEFGGPSRFTPAFIPADQCRKNCSFVSGHVAMASFVMAFGWLGSATVRRRWLVAGVAAGGTMGLMRMIPGGHFLSDVIFAWFAVYFSLWLTEWLFRRLQWLPPAAPEEASPQP